MKTNTETETKPTKKSMTPKRRFRYYLPDGSEISAMDAKTYVNVRRVLVVGYPLR